MARPKKSPRERFQITVPKPLAKRLRVFARKSERELSELMSTAAGFYLDMQGLNPERMKEYDKVANEQIAEENRTP